MASQKGGQMYTPINEQETTINFSRDEQSAKIWTSDTTMMTKLDKLVEKDSENWSCTEQKDKDGDVIAKVYIVQKKKLIAFRTDRVLSEEQKETLRRCARANFSQGDR